MMRATSMRHGRTGRKVRHHYIHKTHRIRHHRLVRARRTGVKVRRPHLRLGHVARVKKPRKKRVLTAAQKAKRRLTRKRRHVRVHTRHRILRRKRIVRHRKGRPSHNKSHRRRH